MNHIDDYCLITADEARELVARRDSSKLYAILSMIKDRALRGFNSLKLFRGALFFENNSFIEAELLKLGFYVSYHSIQDGPHEYSLRETYVVIDWK